MTTPSSNTPYSSAGWRQTGAASGWVEAQSTMDHVLQPFEDVLMEELDGAPIRRLLDVGCGTGGTTLAAARRLGDSAECVGVDISEQMIAAANARAAEKGVAARFICADAQTHRFEPPAYDHIMSRFGLMFFEDTIQAFTNLRQAAVADASLTFIAWRAAEETPFMTAAERAAAPLLPNLPPRVPDAPGQFAFADGDRVRRLLEQSGWADIRVEPLDRECDFPATALDLYITRLGPVGRALSEVDEETRARVLNVVRPAFELYVHGDDVRFAAACWLVRARVPAE